MIGAPVASPSLAGVRAGTHPAVGETIRSVPALLSRAATPPPERARPRRPIGFPATAPPDRLGYGLVVLVPRRSTPGGHDAVAVRYRTALRRTGADSTAPSSRLLRRTGAGGPPGSATPPDRALPAQRPGKQTADSPPPLAGLPLHAGGNVRRRIDRPPTRCPG